MGVTSASQSEDPDLQDTLTSAAAPSEGPTRQLLSVTSGETCVSCESPLASDQRYCLNCGERRGKSRFPAAAPAETAASAPPRQPRRRRLSPNATLVTGVATLLLAMGVGVEIGRLGNNSSGGQPARAASPGIQVVTVGGGGTASTASTSSSKSGKGKGSKGKNTVVHVTKKVQAKADQAASKVLGSSSKNLAPTTVQPGQTCTHGAGCQGGKFTGNFFGG